MTILVRMPVIIQQWWVTIFHCYCFFNIAGLLCCPQRQWHISHLADILINIWFFQSKTQRSSLLGFPGILVLSPWIFAACSCRNKTNIKPTSPFRACSRMGSPWGLSSLSAHASHPQLCCVRAHKRLALASTRDDIFLMESKVSGPSRVTKLGKSDIIPHDHWWVSNSPRGLKGVTQEKGLSFNVVTLWCPYQLVFRV